MIFEVAVRLPWGEGGVKSLNGRWTTKTRRRVVTFIDTSNKYIVFVVLAGSMLSSVQVDVLLVSNEN